MVPQVFRAVERIEEDEAGGDGGIQHAEENERRDHEAERDFLVDFVAEGAKGGRDVVVCPCVGVDDGADETEEDDFGDGDGPEGFGELARVAHLGDERGENDLPYEGVADVEEGVHAFYEARAFGGDGEHGWRAEGRPGWVTARVCFDAGEDGG